MFYDSYWRAEVARIKTALSYPPETHAPSLWLASRALPLLEHLLAGGQVDDTISVGRLAMKILRANDFAIMWECLNGSIDGRTHWQYSFGVDALTFTHPILGEPHEIDCPDCRGSGQYVGFSAIEVCRRCNGAKKVNAEPPGCT